MLNYIIATYAANKWEYSLQIQLQNLYSIIMQDQTKYISQVTIVCPKVKENHIEHAFYYQKESWTNLFKKSRVKLVYLEYVGDNTNASYDQWIQAYLAYPNFDYFLFIEDDYYVHPSLLNFDSILVDFYNESIREDGTGYLCTLASKLHALKHHAAISNGIVNKQTMVQLGPNVLDDFYQLASTNFCQYAFSIMFENKNMKVLSMHNKFAAWFWSSVMNHLQVYSDKNVVDIFFAPIQHLLQPNFTVKYIDIERTEHVESKYKPISKYRLRRI